MSYEGILGLPRAAAPALSEQTTGRDVLRETIRETLETNPANAWWRSRELDIARDAGQRLPAETARARIREAGLEGRLTVPDQGLAQAALDILIERKRTEIKRAEVMENGPGGPLMATAQFGAAFGASLVDPINIATGFVPVVSGARYSRWLQAAGTGVRGAAGRTAIRMGVGSAEGAVGSALVEPIIASAKANEQADYDGTDSLYNIAFGSVFGGGLHVIGGGAADIYRASRGQPAVAPAPPAGEVPRGTEAPAAAPEPVSDAPLSRAAAPPDDYFARAVSLSREMRRSAGVDVNDPAAVSQAIGVRARSLSQYIRETGGISDVGGELSARDVTSRTAPGLIRKDEMGDASIDAVRERVFEEGFFPGKSDYNEISDSELFDAIADDLAGNRVYTAEVQDRLGPLRQRQEFLDGMREHGIDHTMTPTEIADRLRTMDDEARAAGGAVFDERDFQEYQSAAAVMERAAHETREAALRAAVAQAASGREVDVQAVVDMDPKRQGADGAAAARAAAERNARPEAAALVDPEVAAAVPEPGPRKPLLDEAQEALDEAVTNVTDTLKAGAEAYKYSRGEVHSPLPVYYSNLLRVLGSLPPTKAGADQWIATLKNKGVKPEEIEFYGLKEWMDSLGRTATRDEVAEFIRANELRVDEVVLTDEPPPLRAHGIKERLKQLGIMAKMPREGLRGWVFRLRGSLSGMAQDGEAFKADQLEHGVHAQFLDEARALIDEALSIKFQRRAKFDEFRLPGADPESYRELLLRLPENVTSVPFKYPSHWDDSNVVAHVRFDERISDKQDPVLHIAEIQSDWHQKGRKQGYEGEVVPADTTGWDAKIDFGAPAFNDMLDAATGERVPHDTWRLTTPDGLSWAYPVPRGWTKEQVIADAARRNGTIGKPDDPADWTAERSPAVLEGSSVWYVTSKNGKEKLRIEPASATPESVIAGVIKESVRKAKVHEMVPQAPFKTTWPELAFKRVLRWAAENGHDEVTWDVGATAAERFGQTNSAHMVRFVRTSGGVGAGPLTDGGGMLQFVAMPSFRVTHEQFVDGFNEVAEIIGPELTEVMLQKGRKAGSESGLGASIWSVESGSNDKFWTFGGEGMQGFYDQMLPSTIGKMVKKYGAKVTKTQVRSEFADGTADEPDIFGDLQPGSMEPEWRDAWSVKITKELRDAALAGFPLFTRGGSGTMKAADLEVMVRESFGDATDALLQAGRIQVVDSVKKVPGGPHPKDARAVFAPDGTTFIVAENMPAEAVRGVVLHEVGVHAGMQQMLGDDLFAKVLDDLDGLAEAGDKAVLRARAMVPSDTPAALVREETLAYLVQSAPRLKLVQRVLAAVKAWWYRLTGGKAKLGEADFVALAESALRRQARGAGDPAGAFAYSRGTDRADDPKEALKPFDEAIKRAEVYGKAVRAAAERLGNDEAARQAMRVATADKLATEEIDSLLETLKTENRKVRGGLRKARQQFTADDTVDGLQEAAVEAAETVANNLALDAVIEKRNAALALTARTKAVGRILGEFASNPKEGLLALLGGSQFARQGSKESVFHWQRTYFTRWTKGMLYELERDGVAEAFIQNAYDRDVAKALHQIGQEQPNFDGIDPEAVKIATIVHKYSEDARRTRNRFGAWIGKLDDYIGSQKHDFMKIRAAGRDAWKDFIRERLDVGRTMPEGGDLERMLDGLYEDFAAGRHMGPSSGEEKAVGAPGSLVRRISQSRVLHFRDADAQFEYMQQFGAGKLHEAILGDLARAGQQAGLLRVLGPNPEDTLRRVMDEVEESMSADPVQRRQFYEARATAESLLQMLDGRANIPGSHIGARVGAGLRAWQSLSKLGGAVVSSVTDLPVYASQIRYQGRGGLLSGMGEALGRLVRGRPKGEQRAILGMIDSVADGMIGGIAARFDADELLGGKTSELMRLFFRYNGLQWWTDTLREGAELGTSNWLASLRGKPAGQIGADAERLLVQYGIGASEWDAIRTGSLAAADGRHYLTPEGMRDMPESAVRAYLERSGRSVTPAAIENTRRDLADRLRNLIIDQAMTAVVEPDVRSRYVWTRGSKPGTVPGEVMRMIGQFKGFPTALTRQVFGREIFGRGYDSLGDYLKRGKGDMLGLAQMIVAMTAFGYVAMAAKDMLKGRTPRDPTDGATWLAAMLQGGAMGIYGDFLLGQSNRFGRNIVDTMAGPVFGVAGDLDELRQRVMRGDDVASSAFRLAVNNTPFLNLFYTRIALDYLILYRIQEALNPGALRRMERRIERENGQEFLLRPSEAVN